MKKWISVLLTLITLLSLAAPAYATEDEEVAVPYDMMEDEAAAEAEEAEEAIFEEAAEESAVPEKPSEEVSAVGDELPFAVRAFVNEEDSVVMVEWNAVAGAQRYVVHILDNDGNQVGSPIPFDSAVVTAAVLPFGHFSKHGVSEWMVEVEAEGADGEALVMGESEFFSVDLPTLSNPVVTMNQLGRVTCTPVEGATVYQWRIYRKRTGQSGDGTPFNGSINNRMASDLSSYMEAGYLYRVGVVAMDDQGMHIDTEEVFSDWVAYDPTSPVLSEIRFSVPDLAVGEAFPAPSCLTAGAEVSAYSWRYADDSPVGSDDTTGTEPSYRLYVTVRTEDGTYLDLNSCKVCFNDAIAGAISEIGDEGNHSYLAASAAFAPDLAPDAPSISYCTNTADGTKVAWKVSDDVDGYILYRNNANIGTFDVSAMASANAYNSCIGSFDTSAMADGAIFTFVDTGADTNNYKYQYTLVAYNTYKGAKYKSTRSITKGIYHMNASPIEKLENTGSGVKLTWAKVSGCSGYKIYRDNVLVYTSKGASGVTWTDTGAKTNGTKYQYKVQCYKDYNGQTFAGVPGSNKTIYFVSKPSISTISNDTAGAVKLTWAKNGKATGYKVEYSTKSDFSSGVKSRTLSTNTSTVNITGLTKGTTYYFRVTTQMKVGTATYKSAVSAVKSLKLTK